MYPSDARGVLCGVKSPSIGEVETRPEQRMSRGMFGASSWMRGLGGCLLDEGTGWTDRDFIKAISSIREVITAVYNIYRGNTHRSTWYMRSVIEGREDVALDLLALSDLFEELVGAVEIVVNDDEIVHVGLLGEGDFGEGGLEALLDGGFGFGAAALEAVAQGGHGGWGDEEVDGVEVGLFDLADTLERNDYG